MKYTQLPVLGEREWLNHINKSFQEVGNMIQLSDSNSDYVLSDGASKASNQPMYMWRNILTDGNHSRTIIAAVGNIHHGELKTGTHFTIHLPWEIGRGSQISSNVFDTYTWKGEITADQTVQFIALNDVPEADNWFDFRVEWPY